MISPPVAQPDVLGAQLPRVCWVPPYVSSTGAEAIELADLAGLHLDPWQQFVLTQSLGERQDGNWGAFEVGLMVSRQNGKGGLLEARELAGLFLLGERLIIHSAHQFDTSLEAFRRLLDLVEGTPELCRRLKGKPSHAHGKEGFELKGGQRIRFRTRTKGGGRGFTGDCLILDEAMDIPEATHAALLPTLSARPNPQVWYTGSAVDQEIDDNGVVFARIRERGHRGDDPSLAYFEYSADRAIEDVDQQFTADPSNWAQANPALGIRITPEYVKRERASFGATRKFAVERLGIGDWPRTDGEAVRLINSDDWVACRDDSSQLVDPVYLAFDVSPDRSSSSIGVAGTRSDNLAHVEVIERRRGTRWVKDRLQQLVADHDVGATLYDAAGPAASLGAEIEEAGIDLVPITAKEHALACGIFFDAVRDSQLRHLGQSELDAAVDGAASRPLGESWAWSRRSSSSDISPLVACTIALWGSRSQVGREPQVWDLNEVVADLRLEERDQPVDGVRSQNPDPRREVTFHRM